MLRVGVEELVSKIADECVDEVPDDTTEAEAGKKSFEKAKGLRQSGSVSGLSPTISDSISIQRSEGR
jgi:hypothetical protein